MIALFTDYGIQDPYVGLLKTALIRVAPNVTVIDLMHTAPAFNPHAGAHLLAALAEDFPYGTVFLGVVDPGVGGLRQAVVVEAGGRWFVGPDNGLFSVLVARSESCKVWKIHWSPENLSATFHGRDLFAPIAAQIATDNWPADKLTPIPALEVQFDSSDLARVIYLDHFGNAWTGLRGESVQMLPEIEVRGHRLNWQRTFSNATKGTAFWYVNSVGLVEVAANRADAAQLLGLSVGDMVRPILHSASAPDTRLH